MGRHRAHDRRSQSGHRPVRGSSRDGTVHRGGDRTAPSSVGADRCRPRHPPARRPHRCGGDRPGGATRRPGAQARSGPRHRPRPGGHVMAEQGLAALDAEVEVLEPWETREAGPFRSPRSRPLTASATRRSPGSSRPPAAGSCTAATRCSTAPGGRSPPGSSRSTRSSCRSTGRSATSLTASPRARCPSRWSPVRPPRPRPARRRSAVPIHYDGIEVPGLYEQVHDPAAAFAAAAAAHDLEARILTPGEPLAWAR